MNGKKQKLKIKSAWKYALLLFAFICCGFVFKASKIEAAPVISIPNDSDYTYDDTMTFYIGYDNFTINSLQYNFGDSWKTFSSPDSKYSAIYKDSKADNLCSKTSYIYTCTNVILEYKLTSISNKGLVVKDNGKFTFSVKASNEKLVFGGESSKSVELTYDGKAPSIKKITVVRNDSSSSSKVIIGNVLKFNVELSELSYIANKTSNSDKTAITFKIGGATKTAYCASSSSKLTTSFSCTYTIVSGDSGSISTSDVKVVKANNIKDQYGNAMASTISNPTFSNPSDLSVDGIKPTITSIESVNGVYSANASVQVMVTFSENLYAVSGAVAPSMKVKFGEGTTKTCTFNSAAGLSMLYLCVPASSDQGALTFVSLSGGSGYKDSAGNSLDLTYSSKTFSGVIANNDIPTLDGIKVEAQNCTDSDSKYYCGSDKKIIVTFSFNMNVSISSKNVVIKFGGNNAKNSYSSSYDETQKTFTINYTINSQDNGEMTLEYTFTIKGDNAISNTVSNMKNNCNVYVDNKVPTITGFEAYAGQEKLNSSNIYYGKNGMTLEFRATIDEDSIITIDGNQLFIVDENNNGIAIDQNGNYGITKATWTLNGKVLNVTLTITGEYSAKLKLKVGKLAVADSFGLSLANDYYSEAYAINTYNPKFNVELVYPDYKGYNNGSSWTLISGLEIGYKLSSNDVDLKDYCVTISPNVECETYSELSLNKELSYTFNKKGNGSYSFYVRVRDNSLNVSEVLVSFEFREMFSYSNGEGANAKAHSITVDTSLFSNGSSLKYGWFKKGASVSFGSANITSKQSDSIVVDGEDTFNGEYRVCINDVSKNETLCSGYVRFDTKIDSFDVDVPTGWTNVDVPVTINFNDASTINCIAISKNVSNINCDRAVNSDVVIYRGAQAISPLKKYNISENGVYYFYIEDTVGNSKMVTKTVTNIDKESIEIEVFNGQTGQYNTNLEIDSYKKVHSFLVTFDRNETVGSTHQSYKYFFTTTNYSLISSKDVFDSYYLGSSYRQEVTNGKKSLTANTPNADGNYNLYIMAVDAAGNVSFKVINGIMVDASGPIITMYDANNVSTLGGSNSYIAVFDYSFVIEDKASKLDLNTIVYKWINSSKTVVIEKKYQGCSFGENTCGIMGNGIEFGSGLFDPNDSYQFSLTAEDYAGNVSTFISNPFKIDTTVPIITINVDSNLWYESGDISFTVKKNNVGTISSVAYCLNDCLTNNEYNLSKFKYVSVDNSTEMTKSISVTLVNGINTVYVYASDVFGNYAYKSADLKHDTQSSEISVSGLNSDGVIDLSGKGDNELSFTFTIKDAISGIDTYCIYYTSDLANKTCYDTNGAKEVSRTYSVAKNGEYTIETTDVVGNETIYNVNVIGIDTEPIEFDLVTNVAAGQFVNGNLNISIVNMRKFMVDDVSSRVATIDYVKLGYNTAINDYEEIFNNGVINFVYNKATSSSLVTSFIATENKAYVVRIVDTGGNVSYNYIRINCIDNVAPFINTTKAAGNKDRIYLYTSNEDNLRIFVKEDNVSKIYKYSNDVIKLFFGYDSLKDESTGYNTYLGLKVCFESTEKCTDDTSANNNGTVYKTYDVRNSLVDGWRINYEISISAPYNFSGIIRYYLVDGAGNKSAEYYFEVEYKNEVSDVTIVVEGNGSSIDESKKYNEVSVALSGDEVSDIISDSNAVIEYALVESGTNLYNVLANNGSAYLLRNYGFDEIRSSRFDITKANVDEKYYLWVYVKDLLNNEKLFRYETLIKMDSIAPSFSEISFAIDKVDSITYILSKVNFVEGYTLYIDSDSNGVYELVEFDATNKAIVTISGVSSVNFKLVDEAGNYSVMSNSSWGSATSETYAKVYQNGNRREVDIVIYNLGDKNVTYFAYIVTEINASLGDYTDDSINDNTIVTCTRKEATCKDVVAITSQNQNRNTHNLDLTGFTSDVKIIVYLYVNGKLIKTSDDELISYDVKVDDTNPSVTLDDTNPTFISTVNGKNYNFKVSVVEENLSDLNNNKYILTTRASISSFDSVYNSCISSTTCARGTFALDSNRMSIITINSDLNKFSNLVSGTYYLYVYVEDDFGNKAYARSGEIVVDNSSPEIAYSTKTAQNSYTKINGSLYVGEAIKLRLIDADSQVDYFEVYTKGVHTTTCYISGNGTDYNCVRDSFGETGLKIEANVVYYYLDNDSYVVKTYDSANNCNEVTIDIDASDPNIILYKKTGDNYDQTTTEGRIFSELTSLYIRVIEDNFNYLTIDLKNTNTNEVVNTASRYSYNSVIGECLVDSSTCPNGVKLTDLLVGNSIQYNRVIVNVYDKANRVKSMEIRYDDSTPEIWTLDVGESVYIAGMLYTLKEDKTIDLEIGVNTQLTTDVLLSKVVLSVDGMSYYEAKNTDKFRVNISRNGVSFDKDLCMYIGNYVVELTYTDEAGNSADSETLNINVSDNTNPEINDSNEQLYVEIKDEITFNGITSRDNYGLEDNGNGLIIKEKTLYLKDAKTCTVKVSGSTFDCGSNVGKVSDNTYKFMVSGEYTFAYEVIDLAGNSVTATQVIVAGDSKGPEMTSSTDNKTSFELYFGSRINGNLNINNISLNYPNAFDKGDGVNKAVEYVGLFAMNNMGDKYKVSDDLENSFLISNTGSQLIYSFKRIGIYYLRFNSVDASGNISIFEYEVKVLDAIAPSIAGVSNEQVVKMDLVEEFSVENIIAKYSIVATDNYDSNVKIYYELGSDPNHSYKVTLRAGDSSNNFVVLTVYVDIEDRVAPTSGELALDDSTNKTQVDFVILGGNDNSNNWWHEYSIQDGNWIRVDENSKLVFGEGLSQNVQVCVRAVDAANNISLNQSCKTVLVDTKAPEIKGIKDGDIVSTEVEIAISDDRLSEAEVWFNGNLLPLNIIDLPFKFTELGSYHIVARDALGNETVVSFVISVDIYMDIVNDINAKEYTITSVEFDKRFLVRVDITYDANGYSSIYANLNNIKINSNDMLYILGVVPNSDATFVMFSVNGVNIGNYANGVNLIGNGNNFKAGVNNEDCFVKFNDYYYAYILVKENATSDPVAVVDDNTKKRDDSKLLSGLFIGLGSIVVVLVGYQIVKFRKRVRAA